MTDAKNDLTEPSPMGADTGPTLPLPPVGAGTADPTPLLGTVDPGAVPPPGPANTLGITHARQAAATGAAADAAGQPRASAPRRGRPRFATILWGVLLLAFAGFMVIWTALPVAPDLTLWLLGGVIMVGLLLVVAGVAAASRRAG